MGKKRKFLLASWLLCVMIAISGGAAACFNSEGESSSSQDGDSPGGSIATSIPEGTVDFDESWVDE